MEDKLREIREEVPIVYKEEATALVEKMENLIGKDIEAKKLKEEFEKVERMLLALEKKIKENKDDNKELMSKFSSAKHEIIMLIAFCGAVDDLDKMGL